MLDRLERAIRKIEKPMIMTTIAYATATAIVRSSPLMAAGALVNLAVLECLRSDDIDWLTSNKE